MRQDREKGREGGKNYTLRDLCISVLLNSVNCLKYVEKLETSNVDTLLFLL